MKNVPREPAAAEQFPASLAAVRLAAATLSIRDLFPDDAPESDYVTFVRETAAQLLEEYPGLSPTRMLLRASASGRIPSHIRPDDGRVCVWTPEDMLRLEDEIATLKEKKRPHHETNETLTASV